MEASVKRFEELSLIELYQILQLRSEVFVVEQSCIYQDLDGKDQKAIHVLGTKEGKLVAYTRIFRPGHYFKDTSIGRVVVKEPYRKDGYGKKIMKASLLYISEKLKEKTIELSAQTYLVRFYNGLGFKEKGVEYLEDGIPHIKMTYGTIS